MFKRNTQAILQAFNASESYTWGLFFVLVFAYSVVASGLLLNHYQSQLDLAQDNLTNLALVHDENLLLQMSNIESIARVTVDEIQNTANNPNRLQTFVTDVAQQLPQLRTIVVTDAAGVIIVDSRPEAPAMGIDVSDRAYFRVHAVEQTNALYIDDPVLSRVDATWSLPITLGVRDDEGTFLGIVVASLDPIYFSSSIGAFTGQDIIGYIIKDDGTILTSLPYVREQIGSPLPFQDEALLVAGDDILPDNETTLLTNDNLIVRRSVEPYVLDIVFTQPRASITQEILGDLVLTLGMLVLLSSVTFLVFYQQLSQTRRIRQSETEYRTLTDNISDFVVRFNRNLEHVYVNPALLASTGLSREDYIGKTNRDLDMPEDTVAFWDAQMQAVFDSKRPQSIEFNFEIMQDAQWFQAKLTPEIDAHGEVQTILSVVRDITDLKMTQTQLEEKTRILSLSLQAAQAGVWVWDIDTNTIEWDDMMEQMHGLPIGSFGGTYDAWRACVHPDDIVEIEASLIAAIDEISDWERVFRIQRKDGSVRHLLAQATIVTHPTTGDPTRIIGVNIDITDRIEAEQKRLESERARIEIEEQHKLIELKERFIATASHDFRTPLSVIQSSTDLLEAYGDQYTPEQRDAKLDKIKAQVQHMVKLMDDVLIISKSHAQKIELSLTRIKLREFCQEIWSNVLTLDNGQHLKEFNYEATLEYLIGDPSLLRQVLDNLLSNALKYTPEGKLIRFSARNDDEYLYIDIVDKGYGIPREDIGLLFEPFHRARNVANIKGTGLGLAIVKDFVALHGGKIDVSSKEGEGTQFTVTLPIRDIPIS